MELVDLTERDIYRLVARVVFGWELSRDPEIPFNWNYTFSGKKVAKTGDAHLPSTERFLTRALLIKAEELGYKCYLKMDSGSGDYGCDIYSAQKQGTGYGKTMFLAMAMAILSMYWEDSNPHVDYSDGLKWAVLTPPGSETLYVLLERR